MTIMLGKVYAALKAAGAPDDEAMAAAGEVGHMREEFSGLRSAMQELGADMQRELRGLRADFRTELNKLREDVRAQSAKSRSDHRGEAASMGSEIAHLCGWFDVLIWAVGINTATTIAILGVLLRH